MNTVTSRKLNPQQRAAVATVDGPVLVLAGAGTGKTFTVIERIAHLIRAGIRPQNILAVTFTNKAADELKARLKRRLRGRGDVAELTASTFHSLCVKILRREAERLGYTPHFTIADQGEQLALVRKAARTVVNNARLRPEDLLFDISRLKSDGVTPRKFATRAVEEREETLAAVYRRYEEALKRLNALDFDDLLLKALAVLADHPAARAYWQKRFTHLLVDEFQDTSEVQLKSLEHLAGEARNLCVVGDDDQSIYSWRGAQPKNILQFHRRFPGAAVIALEENYRSVNGVLRASNALIRKNEKRHEKTLWSRLGDGAPPRVIAFTDQEEEAERIVEEIRRRVRAGASADSFAVILRTNGQTRPFEDMLQLEGLPYIVLGGQSFYDRKEVRDVLAFLTLAVNPRNDAALRRVVNTPARGISDATVDKLDAFAAAKGIPLMEALGRAGEAESVNAKAAAACAAFRALAREWSKRARGRGRASLVETVLEETEYLREVEHLYTDPLQQAARYRAAAEVGESLRRYLGQTKHEGLSGFVQEAALVREETKEKSGEAVKLITAHSAKGLEFPHVYVAGLEEGLLPHKNTLEDPAAVDEERRLLYVAMTRAQRELTLSYCRGRTLRGKTGKREPSRFLAEIPDELLHRADKAIRGGDAKRNIAAIRAMLEDE